MAIDLDKRTDNGMSEEEWQQIVNNVYEYVAKRLVEDNIPPSNVEQELIDRGILPEDAKTVVSNVQIQISEAKNKRSKKDMLYGALWCVGGILVTVLTYDNAAEKGGSYIVAWGAILFGGIQFFKGLFKL